MVRGLVITTIGVSAVALVGRFWRFTAPAAAVGVGVVLSYRSSWGQIFHTENLLVLHLMILGAVALVDGDRPGRRTGDLGPQAMTVVLVVAYVLAGWAKLRIAGLDWVSGDSLRNHVAHDNLRKVLVGDWHSPLGGWVVGHGWMFGPLAVVSLVTELAAPVALLGGRLRTVWVAAAWLFHLGVLALMAIVFPYQLSGVAFVCCWAVGAESTSNRRPRAGGVERGGTLRRRRRSP